MYIDATTMENSMEVPQKLKMELLYDPTIPFLEIEPRNPQNTNLKIYMHPNVHNSTIHNSKDIEAT